MQHNTKQSYINPIYLEPEPPLANTCLEGEPDSPSNDNTAGPLQLADVQNGAKIVCGHVACRCLLQLLLVRLPTRLAIFGRIHQEAKRLLALDLLRVRGEVVVGDAQFDLSKEGVD